ncbi:sugar phosphorylase [Saccharospirillum salsuginis]|uniref:Sucrose phosphorylase n=1 Tax=Saccharospirillum salsuginis TaxID=418750 RepID=A0A918NF50_9GAMM|nr:sugar phosphorylase [Saccharospirillum salsuginis]GGX63284.1 sucrose phosphorylase [Saccharospirillum salsuginis]
MTRPEDRLKTLRERARQRLAFLYGEERADDITGQLLGLVQRYQSAIHHHTRATGWDETDTLLITYGDAIRHRDEPGLLQLERFLEHFYPDRITNIHLLPFFPYSSDDGFSVIDFKQVRETVGHWDHIDALARRFGLMFDLVLNHCSRENLWFIDFIQNQEPGCNFFIELDPKTDLSRVTRPRSSPLLAPINTHRGTRHVWATFSEDQIDLNYANPDVLLAMMDIFLFYLSKGARLVRLDAVAFLWKQLGTSCIHLPETHEIVKLMRDIVDAVAPWVILVTETNVPHAENLSYFGDGDEAGMVYQFALPPLVLYTLNRGNADLLTNWAMSLAPPPEGGTYLNFTASHDGIGLRALEGMLPNYEVQSLLDCMHQFGGYVSMKANPDGRDTPYEINISYFDALRGTRTGSDQWQIERFLCSQTLMMSLQGIPAFYLQSLIAAPNDLAGVERTGRLRSINRKVWPWRELNPVMTDPRHPSHIVSTELNRRIELRQSLSAFHPDARQRVEDMGSALFVVRREGTNERVYAVFNVTTVAQTLSLDRLLAGRCDGEFRDVIGEETYRGDEDLVLQAYQGVWLVVT